MKDVKPILQSLGLLDSEIDTYLAALENGPDTAIELAKLTGLSRQAVYTAIETLSKRGLMSSSLEGKRKMFAAEPPDKLLAYARRKDAEMHERVRDLERLVPELEMRTGGERPVVKVFEGKEGMKTIIDDIRSSREKESYEITDLDAMYKVLSPEDLASMRQALQKAGRKVRGIYSGKPTRTAVDVHRRFLPSRHAGFESNIGIYGNKVIMVTFKGKMHSIMIESGPIAKAVRILFKMAFKGSSEDRE
ncbi:hypothetical protein AMJ57_03420 [Parcubacteria bacterium SG8_24]|nr:MAG: hypothetical protein AMJ57_03420 [Parcubacteria bacterium SG8_24]